MEKINLVFSSPKNIKIHFQEQTIIIDPYIDSTNKVVLISSYIDNLYGDRDISGLASRYVIAELSLVLQIIDLQTNISVEGLNIDDVINSGLWESIYTVIKNYHEFRQDLSDVIKTYVFEYQSEKMLGSAMEKLIDKFDFILQKMGEMDANSLQSSIQDFSNQLKELNDTVPGIVSKPKISRKRSSTAK